MIASDPDEHYAIEATSYTALQQIKDVVKDCICMGISQAHTGDFWKKVIIRKNRELAIYFEQCVIQTNQVELGKFEHDVKFWSVKKHPH